MAKYDIVKPDEWIRPVMKGYKMACCDCGLVHEFDFRIYHGKIQLRGRRNNYSTAKIRQRGNHEFKKS